MSADIGVCWQADAGSQSSALPHAGGKGRGGNLATHNGRIQRAAPWACLMPASMQRSIAALNKAKCYHLVDLGDDMFADLPPVALAPKIFV